MKPCTSTTGRHAWAFAHNTTVGSMRITLGGGSSARFTLKGLYRCTHCGAKKHGAPNHDAPGNDLRTHLNPTT